LPIAKPGSVSECALHFVYPTDASALYAVESPDLRVLFVLMGGLSKREHRAALVTAPTEATGAPTKRRFPSFLGFVQRRAASGHGT
jgi:hypothetical protein